MRAERGRLALMLDVLGLLDRAERGMERLSVGREDSESARIPLRF